MAFVRRARWRGVVAAALVGLLPAALAVAAAWWLSLRFAPAAAGVTLGAASAVAGALLAFLVWRAPCDVAALDAHARLGDALVTYWPLRRADNRGMAGWLEASLAARLAVAPVPPTAQRAARRTLRRLLPLLPLLLLLWLLLLWLPAGLGGGDRAGVEGGPAEQAGGDGTGSGGSAPTASMPDTQGGATAPPPSAVPPSPPPGTDDGRGDGVAARPLQLPVREEFVVPGFVGDGPSRPAKARQAVQDVAAAPRAAAGGAGRAADVEVPPEQEFARAAERAAAGRHVPPAERPIVQRYFKALAERR